MNRSNFTPVNGAMTPLQPKTAEEITPEEIWEQLTPAQQDRLYRIVVRICRQLAQSLYQEEANDERT